MEKKIKVFLADNQVVFREGMHFVLECEEDIEVVGEGRSAQEALAFLQKEPVDVLVLNSDTSHGISQIKEMFPGIGVILVGESCSAKQYVVAGNSVSLSRDMDPGELAAAVRKAYKSDDGTPAQETVETMEDMKRSLREHLLSLVESL